MIILYCAIAILVTMAYLYIPAVCLYGIVRLQMDGTPSDTICNPFFGLKKVSMKTGLIAWSMQVLYLGVIVSDLYFCYFHGTHPFFFDFLNL